MNTFELLQKAIKERKPISFEYNKPGKDKGKRIGDPHAIFISTTDKTNVDIYQRDGISEKGEIPGWRPFTIDFIDNIEILLNKPSFEIAPDYNPESKKYVDILVKI